MKDNLWQKRQFILSSFSRLNIPISTQVYRFADYLISSGWKTPLDELSEIDRFISQEYQNFLNNG
jgi:hypothetical protein